VYSGLRGSRNKRSAPMIYFRDSTGVEIRFLRKTNCAFPRKTISLFCAKPVALFCA
jgi:hypothetical protein